MAIAAPAYALSESARPTRQLVELWATASMDDPAVGVTFWLFYDEDHELERALAGVEATAARWRSELT